MERNKRLIYIGAFVLVVIGLGYAMYRVFFYTPKAPTQPPGTETPADNFPFSGEFPDDTERPTFDDTDTLPPGTSVPDRVVPGAGSAAATDQVKRAEVAIDVPVQDTNISAFGNPRFYNKQDGKFYELDNAGRPTELSDQVFFNVEEVTWSPTSDESIIEYPDGANIYYNFATKEQVTLPKHWDAFSFTNTGDRIAAKSLGFSEENRWLISADPTGNNVSLIEPLGLNADKVEVNWSPDKQIVALSTTGETTGADRQEVLFIGQNGENFPSTIVEGRDLRSSWSESGSKLLYSVHNARNDFKPELWVVNGSGDGLGSGRRLLNVDTWADKCSFSDDRFVFCGVPQSLEKGAGFAPSLADATPDDLYKIDVNTGLKVRIPLNDFHVIDTIEVSADGSKLYFTDKTKPGLFEVAL